MDELEELRQKRLRELQEKQQSQMQDQMQQQMQMQQQIAQLENLAKSVLSKEALLRYGTIKAADEQKALQILVIIAQLVQNQQVTEINDAMFRELLQHITPKKKDFTIRRK